MGARGLPGRVRAIALVAVVVVVLGACRSSEGAAVKLDGSPRVPDVEGVVTDVNRQRITLDDGKTYKLTPKLVAVSTYNRHTISVLGTKGAYVHLGLDGDTVEWVARIAVAPPAKENTKAVAIYQGQLRKVDGDRLEFSDGTVLRLAEGLEVTDPGGRGRSIVAIDIKERRVQGITLPPRRTTTTRAA